MKEQMMKKILQINFNPNRIYGLDILRALAILFVVAGHGEILLPEKRSNFINAFIFDGVSIFFVLSGFLIGGIFIKILESQKLSCSVLLSFWLRRWFRTLPNYFLILIFLLIVNAVFTSGFNIYEYKNYFIFSQNLVSNHPYFFNEAWSLSVEEWFYFLIPILVFIVAKFSNLSTKKALLIIAVGILILVTFFRYYRFHELTTYSESDLDPIFRRQVFTRLDSLMYGVIGAYLSFYHQKFWQQHKKVWLAIGIFIFIIIKLSELNFLEFSQFYKCVFSYSVICFATLLLLPYLSAFKDGKGFVYKCITYISLISYSMYLINLSIVRVWILGNIDWSYVSSINGYLFVGFRYLLFWFLTIFFSILLYKNFEVPMMSVRDKIKSKY